MGRSKIPQAEIAEMFSKDVQEAYSIASDVFATVAPDHDLVWLVFDRLPLDKPKEQWQPVVKALKDIRAWVRERISCEDVFVGDFFDRIESDEVKDKAKARENLEQAIQLAKKVFGPTANEGDALDVYDRLFGAP